MQAISCGYESWAREIVRLMGSMPMACGLFI